MKAYRIENPGPAAKLALHEINVPQVRPNEVLVRVHASSLNYRDLMIASGQYLVPSEAGLVPLSDAAGEVMKTGADVTQFRKGDRVANTFLPGWHGGRFDMRYASEQYGSNRDGWLTEYKAVDQNALVHIPNHLSFEEAAALPCAAVTAWSALGGPSPVLSGDTVLVQGTGGVSLFALQLAKMRGARVLATTSNEDKAEKLRKLGADAVIIYTETPAWDEAVRELTDGRGADRVVEIGGPGTLSRSIRATAAGGEISIVGVLAGAGEAIDFMQLFMSGATIRRIMVGSREDFEAMNRAMSLHQMRPVIDSVFSFQEAQTAWQHFKDHKHVGKVVIAHSYA